MKAPERNPLPQLLLEMESSGGEPDVVGHDKASGQYLFCDRRYGKVFVHHIGAQSCYAARGFRGLLRV